MPVDQQETDETVEIASISLNGHVGSDHSINLTVAERAGLAVRFASGSAWGILIGLRGTQRIVTVAVPRVRSTAGDISRVQRAEQRLSALGCDRCVYITARD